MRLRTTGRRIDSMPEQAPQPADTNRGGRSVLPRAPGQGAGPRRLPRPVRSGQDDAGREDFRIKAIRDAIALLDDGQSDRTARILERRRRSTEPVDQAGMKGACGTPPPEDE